MKVRLNLRWKDGRESSNVYREATAFKLGKEAEKKPGLKSFGLESADEGE